ncbi:winged helix-turn-helix transcriptional regulator [Sporosarcina sp. GW1-11]|uniref:winged helix-turn-helix transcriptional regulator n=1 Tax=Sporosarcina sp. GW1-11 TaxID=2899126 RepID=UPI00294E755B|nr:winged helix-turn-helix transcriptional regulator [Sporosarcina sp. GW1-11]MDV6379480.1 winged helix-turn-helix transcriptional regulator [Sporosarcina sp. GW1-11]
MTHYVTKHARFTNQTELHRAVREHIDMHWRSINKTDRAVLELLHSCSATHLAAHISHQEIQTKLNMSNSTVRRTIRKLEKLQIIERITFVRPQSNGLGANIYVILPVGV